MAIALAQAIQAAGIARRSRRRADVSVGRRPLRSASHGLRRAGRHESRPRTADGSPYRSETRPPYGDPSPVRVPVCYGGEFGPDLAARGRVRRHQRSRDRPDAHFAHLSRLHARLHARVHLHGDGRRAHRRAAPGQLRGSRCRPDRSASPARRRASIRPRRRAAGRSSAARRSSRSISSAAEPFLFKPGDAVQFYAIEPAEYARLENAREWLRSASSPPAC